MTITLTDRERLLITEALERLDPDTLNDDLGEDDETSGSELDTLAARVRAADCQP